MIGREGKVEKERTRERESKKKEKMAAAVARPYHSRPAIKQK